MKKDNPEIETDGHTFDDERNPNHQSCLHTGTEKKYAVYASL